MVFTSARFICFFILLMLAWFLVPARYRRVLLLAANIAFYASAGLKYLPVLVGVVVVGYCSARLIARSGKPRVMLTVSVGLLAGLLCFYKYLAFALGLIGIQSSFASSLIAPLGISFFVLTSIGYLIDVSRDSSMLEKNFISYALFVTFFPQLLSGPIPRANRLVPQMRAINAQFDYERVAGGLLRMLIGVFKKLVIADNIAAITDAQFAAYQSAAGVRLLMAALFYTIQIYCDFSSYSDMALGAAKVMGIELDENFKAPYLARTIKEFWRRWHISLSSWFRDYLYIPLGGSRHGRLRTLVNTMIIFVVSGFWHGASFGFLFWGALHGFYLISEILLGVKRNGTGKGIIPRVIRVLDSVWVYLLSTLAWVFFRAGSFSVGMTVLRRIVSEFGEIPSYLMWSLGIGKVRMIVLLASLILLLIYDMICEKRKDYSGSFLRNIPYAPRWAIYYILLFVIFAFGAVGSSSFIYFNF